MNTVYLLSIFNAYVEVPLSQYASDDKSVYVIYYRIHLKVTFTVQIMVVIGGKARLAPADGLRRPCVYNYYIAYYYVYMYAVA